MNAFKATACNIGKWTKMKIQTCDHFLLSILVVAPLQARNRVYFLWQWRRISVSDCYDYYCWIESVPPSPSFC